MLARTAAKQPSKAAVDSAAVSTEIRALLESFGAALRSAGVGVETQQPRKPRKRLRRPEERGLPAREALVVLAGTWLENQRRLWPELVAAGELPPATQPTLVRLAEDFEARFLNKQVALYESKSILPAGVELGGAYERYSSDKSNPASLDQQLLKQLVRARADRVFIPWIKS